MIYIYFESLEKKKRNLIYAPLKTANESMSIDSGEAAAAAQTCNSFIMKMYDFSVRVLRCLSKMHFQFGFNTRFNHANGLNHCKHLTTISNCFSFFFLSNYHCDSIISINFSWSQKILHWKSKVLEIGLYIKIRDCTNIYLYKSYL